MKDNLLFVSQSPLVIQEFLDAMKRYEFETDTADSGQQAARMMEKQPYKVVITGMNLSSFDGNKLIAWLNENFPQTACIVYTTRVDLAELRLLVNERNVFRIFLKPANYHGDFYNAIMDGFSYYDVHSTQKEQQDLLEKRRENAVFNITEMEEADRRTEEERGKLKRFLFPLIRLSMQEFGPEVSQKEVEKLLKYEEEIMDFYLGKNYRPCRHIKNIQEKIQEEFVTGAAKQEVFVNIRKCPEHVPPGFVETIHFIIWIIMHQIALISKHYAVKAEIQFRSPVRAVVLVKGKVPAGALQQYKKQPNADFFLELLHTVVENMTDKYRRELEEEQMCWEIELKMENPKRKKGLSRAGGAKDKASGIPEEQDHRL